MKNTITNFIEDYNCTGISSSYTLNYKPCDIITTTGDLTTTITTEPMWHTYYDHTQYGISNKISGSVEKNIKEKTFIKSVEILKPNKVIRVTFFDESTEKAVCDDEDTFSLEQGITICIAKYFCGDTGAYNRTISKALKNYDNKIKQDKKDKEETEKIKAKKAKIRAKKESKRINYKKKYEELLNDLMEIRKG